MKKYLMLIIVILYGCDATVQYYYPSYNDAIKDDLFNKGWLPDILPKSATKIRTYNDLESSESAGSFILEEQDIQMFLFNLTKLENKINSFIYITNGYVWIFSIDDKNKRLIKYSMCSQNKSEYKDL